MTITPHTTYEWVCDRCGDMATSSEDYILPEPGWLALRESEKGRVGELCRNCSAEFREFMAEGRDEQAEFLFGGTVKDVGGRAVTVLVDEDTAFYPAPGDRIKTWRSIKREGDRTDV